MSIKTKTGITFVEVMVAALLLVVILLPVFNFLTKAVKDTDKIYAECIAITKAKQIMDTMLFQIPWQDIRVDYSGGDNSMCYFEVPPLLTDPDDSFATYKQERHDKEEEFLKTIVPMVFCDDKSSDFCKQNGKLRGDGLIKTEKGIWIRTRAKVEDLVDDTDMQLYVDGVSDGFKFSELTSKDADENYNLVKKIVVQVKWTLLKEKDPNEDKNAKSIFLVGFKSNL